MIWKLVIHSIGLKEVVYVSSNSENVKIHQVTFF